jgi:hypothetical protein
MSVWRDSKGVPIRVNDLLKIYHFTGSRKKQYWLYKRVMIINDKIWLVENSELGNQPTAECHKCPISAVREKEIEILDGNCFDHPLFRKTIFLDDRKRAKGVPDSYYIAIPVNNHDGDKLIE